MVELSPANLELGLEQPLPRSLVDFPSALGMWTQSPDTGGGSGVAADMSATPTRLSSFQQPAGISW